MAGGLMDALGQMTTTAAAMMAQSNATTQGTTNMADPSTGNEVTSFPTSAPPNYYDNGSGAKLLQPANQVPYFAPGAAFSQSDMQKLRDALIVAGIMQSS